MDKQAIELEATLDMVKAFISIDSDQADIPDGTVPDDIDWDSFEL